MRTYKKYKHVEAALPDIINYIKQGYSLELSVAKANARLKEFIRYRKNNPEFNQLFSELREQYKDTTYLQSFMSRSSKND